MDECWFISAMLLYDNVPPHPPPPQSEEAANPWDLKTLSRQVLSCSLGVRLLEVKQMEIWCSAGFILLCTMPQKFLPPSPGWILMWLQADKSNRSSPTLAYNRVSGRPGCNTAEFNLWLTINLREPKHCSVTSRAWRRLAKTAPRPSPDSSPSKLAPAVYLPLYASAPSPQKNPLISNGLILCSQYGLRMFSLMTFQSYAMERRWWDYRNVCFFS